uniref:H/ACA ribonucleoprotein complex non-core subunit NAF1 n=1 Tax=Poecilia formosa TaxID=48698 RepID=A0A096M0G8_POEFO
DAIQTQAEETDGLPSGSGCENEDSNKSVHTDTSTSHLPEPALVFEDVDESFSQPAPIKARDEVLLEELPAVEEVSVSLPEEAELQPVGTVSSIVQQLVIIQSLKNTPALNEDSILFRSDRVAVGKVFEVFGPVCSPFYVLRFNSSDQISSKGLTEGSTVYFAPALKEYTEYILMQQLKLLKGSDASWKNDDEPPDEALDYSDDEKEQEAKRKKTRSFIGRVRLKVWKHFSQLFSYANKTYNGNKSSQQQNHDRRASQPRHARTRVRHQHPRNAPPSAHSYPPPGHTDIPPAYFPSHSPYLPPPHHHHHHHPFSPPSFPLYPPPLPPPAFFNPSFSPSFWHPNSVPYVDFPPPPPPPPPPHPPSPPH